MSERVAIAEITENQAPAVEPELAQDELAQDELQSCWWRRGLHRRHVRCLLRR